MLLGSAACARRPEGGQSAASPAPTEALTEDPTAEPTPEPAPTPTPDPVRAEAERTAAEHGLGIEELRGEYALFLDFAEAVGSSLGIGGYEKLVYRIFPVIADNKEHIDTEYLFSRLPYLSFEVRELDPGTAGQYQAGPNTIFINTDIGESDDNQYPSIIFHELMHFIDFSASPEEGALYLLDGERLSADEFLALPLDDQIRAVIVYETAPVKEGCAELYTAKYFAGAVRSYFDVCSFMTGIECVYGSDALAELFFSRDSDALFAELLLDAGFTQDRYYDAMASLNRLAYHTDYKPKNYMPPEDILIELYEHKLGGGWKTDERFLYVLKALNGVAWSGYEESVHADFLKDIDFSTRQQYESFIASVYADLPSAPELRYEPPAPVIRGGRFTLAAFASWHDPEAREEISGVIAAEYDFGAEKPIGYELIDMDAVLKEYLG